MAMYSDWNSLEAEVAAANCSLSVLNPTFPPIVRRDVARIILKCLANGYTNLNDHTDLNLPENVAGLQTDEQMQWTMEVICYSLQLDFREDKDTIEMAVEVYTSWINTVGLLIDEDPDDEELANREEAVPLPIRKNPESYIQRMVKHLFNVFTPRRNATERETQCQAGLCAIVLSSLRSVSNLSKTYNLTTSTWDTLLITMLRIGDVLLAGPSESNDLTDMATGELYMDTLLNVWLHACVRNFPTPPFWKTLTEYIQSWRHHSLVVEKWVLTSAFLTSRLVDEMHGPGYSQLKGIKEEEISAVIHNLSGNVLIQTWYRFLNLIGNPLEIIDKETFTRNPKFIKSINLEYHQKPDNHPHLNRLYDIFHINMKGITTIVEIFFGWPTKVYRPNEDSEDLNSRTTSYDSDSTRLDNAGFETTGKRLKDYTKSVINLTGKQPVTVTSDNTPPEDKASVNSILHLLGDWLFCAGLADFNKDPYEIEHHTSKTARDMDLQSEMDYTTTYRNRTGTEDDDAASTVLDDATITEYPSATLPDDQTYRTQHTKHTNLTGKTGQTEATEKTYKTKATKKTTITHVTAISDQATIVPNYPTFHDARRAEKSLATTSLEGRAEAIALLCRIFGNKSTSEEVEQIYLVRFYNILNKALKVRNEKLLAAIILNSENLFRVNLPGVEMLIPLIMGALDVILPDSDLEQFIPHCDIVLLRRSAANILLSLLPYIITLPDLKVLPIPGSQNLPGSEDNYDDDCEKLGDLQPRAVHLLNGALETEKDDENVQIILSGLYYTLQECSSREKDCLINPNAPKPIYSHLVGNNLSRNITRSFQLHSAYGLYVQCLSTLNDRLSVQWRNSLPVTLAVFELLSAMSKLRIDIADPGECKRSVMALCNYIIAQANRPAKEHKRELHSMIVAAYNCLSTWLSEHRYLLNDKGCLLEVLHTIEYGISGGSGSSKKTPKKEKQQRPISRRVKNAAEVLLRIISGKRFTL